MKVQQLLQGSKSSQASSRASRSSEAADAKSSDFAEALAGARKRPEPKPAQIETPAAKKPAPAAKKKHVTKDPIDAPADDAVAPQETADDAPPQSPAEPEQATAETDELVASEDADADEADTDLPKADADLSAITVTPNMGPQPRAAEEVEQADAVDAAHPNAIPIRPTPAPQGRPVPADDAIDAVQSPDEIAEVSDDVVVAAAVVLEGLEDLIDEPVAEEDLDAAQAAAARTRKAPVVPRPSIFADDSPDVAEPDASDADESTDQPPLPAIASAVATVDDVNLDDDPPGSLAPANGKDAVTTLTSAPVQGEPAKAQATANAPHAPAAPPPPPPQAQFAEVNHPKIVTAMRGELLPHGGTMSIRLDPPELGALQVLVHMTDGVMTASFQTSNDDATKLLSHSLSQLKAVLESQGVSVEKLQVQQSPRDHQAQHDDPQQQQQRDQHGDAHRQEQQRKEMLRRMWRKLSIGSDPLDLVA
jgi:flagellar hook-length control protein FliK